MKKIIAIIIAIVTLASLAFAEPVEMTPATLYRIGNMYYNGDNVDQSYEEAVKWYTLAAQQDDAEAQMLLGTCYSSGRGVEEDDYWASYWFTLSALQGNDYGQYNLGMCYYKGEGVEQDYEYAAQCFTDAAEQGNPLAQEALDEMREKGYIK